MLSRLGEVATNPQAQLFAAYLHTVDREFLIEIFATYRYDLGGNDYVSCTITFY